ncbi:MULTISPECIES: sugar phosphate isomerase/epimerase family protein [Rhodomicrobium]|uniref:sugar phosphate isomerase/epimerase family protein n=1 Tax=Rhodomicrobium TaxID=1068 RepID=UPI000B4AC9B1|nr:MULTISPECIES: sugar phosphate isomerase/epimerase family protein [Rhodomicrobium]
MPARHYSIGYSLPNVDDYALEKLGPALEEAERYGVDYVEIPLYATDVVANGRVLPERLRAVKALTGGRPFGYTMHGPLGLDLMERGAMEAMHRQVLKAHLDVTAELGGAHLVAHSGRFAEADGDSPADALARQRDALADIADEAQARGITIAVENLFASRPGLEPLLPSELAAEIAKIGHPAIRACLDFSHGYLESTRRGADFVTEAAALAPFAKHLHVHDSFGKLGAFFPHRAERLAYGIGDLHLPFGLGSIPWDELMSRLAFPSDPIFIYELAPPYWSDLPFCLEKLRELAARANIGAAQG